MISKWHKNDRFLSLRKHYIQSIFIVFNVFKDTSYEEIINLDGLFGSGLLPHYPSRIVSGSAVGMVVRLVINE